MNEDRLARRLSREGLPAPAAAAVVRSVAGARLRGEEGDEVARELAAHFRDGLDRGRSLEELLELFGDPAVAAPLIGRGARRRRSPVFRAMQPAVRLAGLFSLLVFAAYLVSFASLHTGEPQSSRFADRAGGVRGELRSWSLDDAATQRAEAAARTARLDAERAALTRDGGSALDRLLGALDVAREAGRGPFPAHDLASLRLTADAVSTAADLVSLRPSIFSRADLWRLRESLRQIRTGSPRWSVSRVRVASEELLSAMYMSDAHGGRLTASGLRIFQAWKGKTEPGLAAFLLEPAYFSRPARRREAAEQLERFLSLAAASPSDRRFEKELERLESSPLRALRFVALSIPLDHLSAARNAVRSLDRELERALGSIEIDPGRRS